MPLMSVGHGRLGRSKLVALLQSADIAALVDIRRYPNSRHNPDVAAAEIEKWAEAAGLSYRWDPRLGGRRRLPTGTDPVDTWWRVEQFAAYAAYTRTEDFGKGLTELLHEATGQPTAMMCSEAVWWRCHRRIVADVATLKFSMPVRHLMHDGRLLPHQPSEGARLRSDGHVVWLGDD